MPHLTRIIPLLAIFIFNGLLPAFSQHKSWRHFSLEDGLAGKEVWNVIEGRDGNLWFSTNQGMCKYNGYGFTQPSDTSKLAFTEAFWPAEDPYGRIWFSRLDNSVWYIQNDSVHYWEYNSSITPYKGQYFMIDQIGFGDNEAIWIDLGGLGFFEVDKWGNGQFIRSSPNNNFAVIPQKDRIHYGFQNSTNVINGRPLDDSEIEIQLWYEDQWKTIGRSPLSKSITSNTHGAWKLKNGDYLILYDNHFYLVGDKNKITRFHTEILSRRIIEYKEGELLVSVLNGLDPGLFLYNSLEDLLSGKGKNILPGHPVTDVHQDHEGGIWVTTIDDGVFYCKNLDLDLYDVASGFPSSDVLRVTNDQRNIIYAGLGGLRSIIQVDVTQNKIMPISPDGIVNVWTDLYFDEEHQQLWCAANAKRRIHQVWEPLKLKQTNERASEFINAKRISKNPSGERFWMSSTRGFYSMNLVDEDINYILRTDSSEISDRTFSVVEDMKGNIWIATNEGLKIWKDYQYRSPSFHHPVLAHQARDMVMMPNGNMVFGFVSGGILVYQPDEQLQYVTTENGLSSNSISRLILGAENEVLACTSSGLNVITFNDEEVSSIEIISSKQGLPSNLVQDATRLNGEYWIATNRGLVHYKNFPKPIPIPKPLITRITANDNEIVDTTDVHLSYNHNNINISFMSMHLRSEGNIQYRYKLKEDDDDFVFTKDNSLNFASLSPGNYAFEIQAQSQDKTWSPSSKLVFEIRRPWWRTWWFISLSCCFSLMGLLIYYSNRLRTIREKSENSNKIKDLELAALRAQMNPHFIFNCLGSIQQFITQNKSEEATRYLSRFAKLIRLALHSSVDGKHSLSHEIDMLDHYLSLEQMRFKGKFDYSIEVDPSLDPDAVDLPPMLIQPFAENAVIHGVRKKDSGGLITIRFSTRENQLEISVMDNGEGIQNQNNGQSKEHKSIGMALTNKRLALLSRSDNGLSYSHSNVTDEAGLIQGFEAKILIPIS